MNTTTLRVRKEDKGHSLVSIAELSDSIGWPYKYIYRCECGYRMTCKAGYRDSMANRFHNHQKSQA